MSKFSEMFPSKYLKAADLTGQQVKVKMSHVTEEVVGSDEQFVVYFEGKDKGLVLNKTNATTIAQAFGDDTEGWCGREIVLFETPVTFEGNTMPSIRVRPLPRKPGSQKPEPPKSGSPKPEPPKTGSTEAEIDDKVPFKPHERAVLLDLKNLAIPLDGDVSGSQVLAPGPGHRGRDRSMTVMLSSTAPEGFIAFSHAEDDFRDSREHVRRQLGLPRPMRPRRP